MRAIEKIIFNELASRRTIVLPLVGTLWIDRRTAEINDRGVKAPVNRVIFTKTEEEGKSTVVSVMEAMGVDKQQAENAYFDWLGQVREGNDITINGVGVLKKGIFTPGLELDQMLNPAKYAGSEPRPAAVSGGVAAGTVASGQGTGTRQATQPAPAAPQVQIRQGQAPPPQPPVNVPAARIQPEPPNNGQRSSPPKGRDTLCLTNILLMIIIVLMLLFSTFFFFGRLGHSLSRIKTHERARVERTAPERGGPGRIERDSPGAAEKAAPATQEEEAAPAPQENNRPQTPAPATQYKKYYIISGAFGVESNADKRVNWYGRYFPDVKAEKIPFKNGMTAVAVYGTDDREDAEQVARQMRREQENPHLWVWEKK